MQTDEEKQLEQEIYDAQVKMEKVTLDREEETKDFPDMAVHCRNKFYDQNADESTKVFKAGSLDLWQQVTGEEVETRPRASANIRSPRELSNNFYIRQGADWSSQ